MYADVIDHLSQLTTYGKLFCTLVRLRSLTMKNEFTTCVLFFIHVVNVILQNLQTLESVNSGKTRMSDLVKC